jgi:hypothetical protein
MAIPDYQFIMHPLVNLLADGQEWKVREVVPILANDIKLTPDERALSKGGRGWSGTENGIMLTATRPNPEPFSVGGAAGALARGEACVRRAGD